VRSQKYGLVTPAVFSGQECAFFRKKRVFTAFCTKKFEIEFDWLFRTFIPAQVMLIRLSVQLTRVSISLSG